MAAGYNHFGGTAADVVTDANGTTIGGQVLTVWTTAVGGTQLTDVLDFADNPTGGSVVTKSAPSTERGRYSFQVPNTIFAVFVDDGVSAFRWAVYAREAVTGYSAIVAQMALVAADTATALANSIDALANSGKTPYDDWLTIPANVGKSVEEFIDAITGQPGGAGPAGRPGLSGFSGVFPVDNPAIGSLTNIWRPVEDIRLHPRTRLYSSIVNLSATPLGVTLVVDGEDVLGEFAPSILTGQTEAFGDLPDWLTIPADSAVQAKVTSMGAGTAGAVPAPTPRAVQWNVNTGTGISNNFTHTPDATWQIGDRLLYGISANAQPTIPSGWALLASAPVTDTPNNFEVLTVIGRTYTAGMANPLIAFSGNVSCTIVGLAIPQVETTAPVGFTGTAYASSASGTNVTINGGTTTVDNETFFAIAGYRYATGDTPATLATPSGYTKVAEICTSRTTAVNFGITIFSKTVATAGTVVAGTTSGPTGGTPSFVRAVCHTHTEKPTSAPSAPGANPRIDFAYERGPLAA